MSDWWLFIFIALSLVMLSISMGAISLAPFVPTRKRDLPRIFSLAKLRPGEIFYDLGCGNGRVVFGAGKIGAKAIGVEVALPAYLYCRLAQLVRRANNISFSFGDLYKKNISEADAVYLFGMPAAIGAERLKNKLTQELKPGVRVISYVFPIKGWQAEETDKPNENEVAIYLYKI